MNPEPLSEVPNRRKSTQRNTKKSKLFVLQYIQIFPSREDFPKEMERRLAAGFGCAKAQSRLQVGAPVWLRLRRAVIIAPLRFFLLCVLVAALRAVVFAFFVAILEITSPEPRSNLPNEIKAV